MPMDIRRREIIAALGSVAATLPFTAHAQVKRVTIGLLGGATSSDQAQWTAAFVKRLNELGWVEGQSVAIEYRWAEGRFERSPEIIAEFVRLKVDVIVTHATANVLAAKQATSVIPIVFASAGDPVGDGLVASRNGCFTSAFSITSQWSGRLGMSWGTRTALLRGAGMLFQSGLKRNFLSG